MKERQSISLEEAKESYLKNMMEVKWRLRCVRNIIYSREAVTGTKRVDFDAAYLQLRICIELLMFALAHGHAGMGFELPSRTTRNEYHAKKVKQEIEKVNSEFFPVPVYLASSDGSSHHFERVSHDLFLSKAEIIEMYGKFLGNKMHASREVTLPEIDPSEALKLQEIFSKFLHLVNWHYVKLGEDRLFLFAMNFESEKNVVLIEASAG